MAKVTYIFDQMSWEKIGLNRRACISILFAMKYKGVKRPSHEWRVADLRKLTRREIAVVPGCGPKTLRHIENRLARVGVVLSKGTG